MDKTIIVYLTRTGHSRDLAEELGKIMNSPVFEIPDATPRKGLFGYLKTGMQASNHASTPIHDPLIPLDHVKTVVLVEPIWASNTCPPMRTWLNMHKQELASVRLAMVASQLGSPPEKFRGNFEEEFGKLTVFANIVERLTKEEKTAILKKFQQGLLELN